MNTQTYYIDKKIFCLQYSILLILLILLVSITIMDAFPNGSTWSLATLIIGIIGIFGCVYFSQKNAQKFNKPTLIISPEGLQFPYEVNEAHLVAWENIAYIELNRWASLLTIYFKQEVFQNSPALQKYFKSLSVTIPHSVISQQERIALAHHLTQYINHSNNNQQTQNSNNQLNNTTDDCHNAPSAITKTSIQYKNIILNHDIYVIFMGALCLIMLLIATGFSGTALILTFILFLFCWLTKVKILKDQTACVISDNNLQVNFYGSLRTIDWQDIESIKIREISRLFSQSSIIEIHLHGQKNSFDKLTWWKKLMVKQDLKRGITPIHVGSQLKDYAIDDLFITLQNKLAQKV